MTGEEFVSGLDKVRKTGTGKWTACCPAHDDKGPSLSIKETDDGRILIHCFAGCAANDVLGAMGLSLTDLFPEPLGSFGPVPGYLRPSMPLRAAADRLFRDGLGVAIISANMNDFGEISDEDRDLLVNLVSRIGETLHFIGEHR